MVCCEEQGAEHFREVDMGGRLMAATTGGAPASPDTLTALREATRAPFFVGYGSTEAGVSART